MTQSLRKAAEQNLGQQAGDVHPQHDLWRLLNSPFPIPCFAVHLGFFRGLWASGILSSHGVFLLLFLCWKEPLPPNGSRLFLGKRRNEDIRLENV